MYHFYSFVKLVQTCFFFFFFICRLFSVVILTFYRIGVMKV